MVPREMYKYFMFNNQIVWFNLSTVGTVPIGTPQAIVIYLNGPACYALFQLIGVMHDIGDLILRL